MMHDYITYQKDKYKTSNKYVTVNWRNVKKVGIEEKRQNKTFDSREGDNLEAISVSSLYLYVISHMAGLLRDEGSTLIFLGFSSVLSTGLASEIKPQTSPLSQLWWPLIYL